MSKKMNRLTTRVLFRLAYGASRAERFRDHTHVRHRVLRQIKSAWEALDAAQLRDDAQRMALASAASYCALYDFDEFAEFESIISGELE